MQKGEVKREEDKWIYIVYIYYIYYYISIYYKYNLLKITYLYDLSSDGFWGSRKNCGLWTTVDISVRCAHFFVKKDLFLCTSFVMPLSHISLSDYSRFHNLNTLVAEICYFDGEAKIVRR